VGKKLRQNLNVVFAGSPCSTSGSNDLGSLNFQSESDQLSFDVISYPAPATFTFTYTGVNGPDSPSEVKDIDLIARCQVKPEVNLFTCYVIVLNVTSQKAAGSYTVTLTNSEGDQRFTFQVLYNGKNTFIIL
jgi:hypothetical protein